MGYKSKFKGAEIDARLEKFFFLPQQVLDALSSIDWEGKVQIDYDIIVPLTNDYKRILVVGESYSDFLMLCRYEGNQDAQGIISHNLTYSTISTPTIEGEIYSQYYIFDINMRDKTAFVEYKECFFKLPEL
jgi:hypothetical protein